MYRVLFLARSQFSSFVLSFRSLRIPPPLRLCVQSVISLGIPAYAYGPGHLAVSHGPDEYADLASLPEAAAIYALTAARLFATP